MKFTKMQGCGNDYVYVNGFEEKIDQDKKPDLVRRLSDRHFGIGGDGVIFINPSDVADFEMEMYNADGSRSEMCGNGIRCVAKYVYDNGLTNQTEISIVSFGKIKYLQLTLENGKVSMVRVNMGSPILKASEVPVVSENEQVINEDIQVEDTTYKMTCVSVGNPHAIIFMDDVAGLKIEQIGPFIENHKRFPNRTNVEFVKVLDKTHVEMRVWERGTGETLACGTGCTALTAACVLNGMTENKIDIKVLGGHIQVEWNREENLLYMTGPAETVFTGEIEI